MIMANIGAVYEAACAAFPATSSNDWTRYTLPRIVGFAVEATAARHSGDAFYVRCEGPHGGRLTHFVYPHGVNPGNSTVDEDRLLPEFMAWLAAHVGAAPPKWEQTEAEFEHDRVLGLSVEELHAEMRGFLAGREQQTWNYLSGAHVWGLQYGLDGSLTFEGTADTVEVLRELVLANRRLKARRSKSAQRAAKKRADRRSKMVYNLVAEMQAGKVLQPADNCRLCGRGLDDAESVNRGIGSECWQGVLEALRAREAA
jgi:hypothetical protein